MYNQISDKYKETELQKIRRVDAAHLSTHEYILVILVEIRVLIHMHLLRLTAQVLSCGIY